MRQLGWACLACGVAVTGCGSGDPGDDSSDNGTSPEAGGSGSGGEDGAGGNGMSPDTGGSGSGGEDGVGGSGSSSGGTQEGSGGETGGSSGGNNGSSGGNSGTGGNAGGPLPPELVWRQEGPDIFGEGIWGSGPNDIYAVGRSGDLIHSTGDGTWLYQTTDTGADLTGIWGSSANDIYVSVNSNMILHSTGDGTWEKQIQTPGYTFDDIWGADSGNIYALGQGVLHGSGMGMWPASTQMITNGSSAAAFDAIWAASETDIYVTDAYGKIHHFGGDEWSEQDAGVIYLEDIHGTTGGKVYSVGNFAVISSSGNGVWTHEAVEFASEMGSPSAVWAANPDAIFVCTSEGYFYASNGAGTWSGPQRLDNISMPSCAGIWGTSPENIYVVTSDGVYHGSLE